MPTKLKINKDFTHGYYKGRADQKEEDNAFFNFEGAWELEKKKVRADMLDKIILAEKSKFYCDELSCNEFKNCSDCMVKYLEELKEKK